jgi:hypothetical protein
LAALSAALASSLILATGASAQSLPEIRTHAGNRVPACVTPMRLMRFLTERNPRLPSQFRNIATLYKEHGERLRVRWDYAFYQMVIETNYLQFRNGSGRGDVSANQNNFAGIGTTGGGVPGDRFPDVSTGVLGQMQHLVAYSGERVPSPVAQRTREKQDDIIALSRRLGRAVTFRDLAGRWAVDRRYGRSIAFVAERYQSRFCSGRELIGEPEAEVADAREGKAAGARASASGQSPFAAAAATGLGGPVASAAPMSSVSAGAPSAARRPMVCKVFTASYGGRKNMLIRVRVGDEMHYTALQVLDGREQSLAESFIRQHAKGGEVIAEHASREAALSNAFDLCPAATGGRG